ncbi:ChaN family lipoprotein [Porphyromonas sp.]|uniref:ChaN family lipoprotein n=1 Tax=Porphyromonas sp. TaxID=1924944 RepID=UPI0026DAC60E|nr:ChaN family lipoprotein [Porphyromonas sp.]MDO4770796.1 ChaN family lipoprotein [Porphyromonas sp.]
MCQAVSLGQVDEKPSYTLFDNTGKKITYSALIKKLSAYDAVFLGEIHNCPISHWLEFEITRSLYNIHQNKLTIGAEMLESDNQIILDEYMSGKITSDRFEAEARLWPNHSTDYEPVVYFAKEHSIPFIATNIPRRYANSVKNHGFGILETLSDEAKRYIAPLPIPFEYNEKESQAVFGGMGMMGGRKSPEEIRRFAEAQAIKDATMGWFIAKNFRHKFLHINGSYHTERKEGIIPYLLHYRPNTSVVTVLFVRQESVSALDEENLGRADFYVCIPEDMVHSY